MILEHEDRYLIRSGEESQVMGVVESKRVQWYQWEIDHLSVDPVSLGEGLAALAFDEHISHLIRPVLNYFPENADFDGISFSSMVHLNDGSSPLAVEFFFPFRMMRCFAAYDCAGQQLLDSGTVVMNGERAALDLQVAEGKN